MRPGAVLILGLSLLVASGCAAQAERPEAGASAPSEKDRAGITAALDAVYAVISGPVGEERDFARMRTLFTPEARLSAIGRDGAIRGGTLEDYIARSGKSLVAGGFAERGLATRIEVYGDLAHAWSSYEGRFTNPDGSAGSVRGINSIQLVRQTDGRWLVQSILWHAETPANPLPADMAGAR